MAQASCFACLAADQLQMVIAALLCQLLKTADPMASCDVSTLLEQAKCFNACSSPAQLMLIQTQLLCNLLQTGGGIGSGSLSCGTSDPVTPPASNCGIYYRTDTGSVWIWDGSVWVLRVA